MTGGLAAYGNSMREGFELTISQINEAGGILGKQVEMVVADDQGTDTECVNAFNSLVSQGIKIIVGAATSGCTSAITGPRQRGRRHPHHPQRHGGLHHH